MQDKANNRQCANCGKDFRCGVQAGEKTCWCFALPQVMPLNENARGCFCPDCLNAAIEARKSMLNLAQEETKD